MPVSLGCRWVFIFLATITLFHPVGATAAEPAPLAGLDAYVTKAMDDWRTPGLAIAVVKDGRVALAKGYGVRRLGESTPVDAQTVFAAASLTKGFTAAALAMLVGQEQLQWDDRVIDHLPDFRLFDPYMTRDTRIRDLLAHRSGLQRGEMLWYYSGFDRAEIMKRLRYLKPVNAFRSRFGYHNLMYVAAGEVVAKVSGRSWDSFVTKNIFTPLGMRDSTTTVRELKGNVATPHARIDGQIKPINWLNIDNIGPAGSINANVGDLVKWMLFQLSDGAQDGRPLIRPEDIAEMQSPQTVLRISPNRRQAIPQTHLRAYGLGWNVEDYRGETLVYHGGRIDGMSAHLALLPRRKLGVVVLSNRGRSSLPNAIAYRIVDSYLGAPGRDWSRDFLLSANDRRERRREKRDALLAERPSGTKPSLPLERYAGAYESELYAGIQVQLRDGALVLHRNANAIADLAHWDYDTFLARFRTPALRDRLITFRLDKLGQVNDLDFEFSGTFLSTDPPLPNDLKIAAPVSRAAGTPAALIGVWSGRWNGILPHTLAIERTDGKNAPVVYAWGRSLQWKIKKRGWRRLQGNFRDGRLTVAFSDTITATYQLLADGTLQAHYRDGSRDRRAVLRRIR